MSTIFFRAGGTLDPAAECYVVRRADDELRLALIAHEYVFLLDSRQKGKSSLIARTIGSLKQCNVRTVKLDLQRIGSNVTPEQWYAGLLVGIGQELDLRAELLSYWSENLNIGPLARWVGALRDVVLARVPDDLVIFIDEVDFVRALDFSTDELFGGIRDCYNRRAEDSAFNRLTFCLVGVATPSQLIRNPDISPFNVGLCIELSDFTLEELAPYASFLEASGRDGTELVSRVHYWVNGHPYLTQLLCSRLETMPEIRSCRDLDGLVRDAFLSPESRQREPNLGDVERRLLDPDIAGLSPDERRSQVLELYGRMLRGNGVGGDENPIASTLRLSGIGIECGKSMRVRNRLYATIFDEKWRRRSLPDAELRRMRGAARRAVLRTALVSAVVVLGVSSAAVGMWRLSNERALALDTLGHRTDDLKRVSTERERSLSALQKKTEELKRVSEEKQRSLDSLVAMTRKLTRVSDERRKALASLQQRADELSRQSYGEQMATINADLAQDHWNRVAAAVDRSKTYPYRGWEWGHVALAVEQGGYRAKFPKWSVFEQQADGTLRVSTPFGIYDLGSPPREVLHLNQAEPFAPVKRVGPFRIQSIDATRGDVIKDAKSQKTLIRNGVYNSVLDIDPLRRVYVIARDASLDVIELRSIDGNQLITSYKGPDDTDAARFLPDGTILSTHTTPTENLGEIRRWDRMGKTLDSAPTDQHYAQGISLSPDGSLYAAWGYNQNVEVRTVKGHTKVSSLKHPNTVSDVVFSKDGGLVLTGCEDGVVRLFDTKTARVNKLFFGLEFPVRQVAFLDATHDVAAMDSEGNARIWHRSTPVPTVIYRDHNRQIIQASLDIGNRFIVSAAEDGAIVSRDLVAKKPTRRVLEPVGTAPLLSRSPTTGSLFAAHAGAIERLSPQTLATERSVKVFDTKATFIQVLPGGRRVLVGSGAHFALLDAQTLKVLEQIEPGRPGKPVDVNGEDIDDVLAFDQERDQFAIFLGGNHEVQIYSGADGRRLAHWKVDRTVLAMTFISGGRRIVVSYGLARYVRDGQTVVRDAMTGREVGSLPHQGRAMIAFAYSPKSNSLIGLTGDRNMSDRAAFVWDANSLQRLGELTAPEGVRTVTLSPDGKRAVTCSLGGTVRVWNSRTCAEYIALVQSNRPPWWVSQVTFSSDGRRLLQTTAIGYLSVRNSMPWN